MKRLNYFIGAAALVAVAMTASPALNAQENGNRDENGKVVRGPYDTAPPLAWTDGAQTCMHSKIYLESARKHVTFI